MLEKNNCVVITVSTIMKRDKLVKSIYSQLTREPSVEFIVQQDQVNRIKVFHNVGGGIKVLIKTYTVVVIPIIVDLSPLYSFYGSIDFHLDDTITHLSGIVAKLQALKGHRTVKGNNNVRTLEKQLAGSLY
jgi:hypothetical protein